MDVTSTVTLVVPVWDDYVHMLEGAIASARNDGCEAQVIVVDNASEITLPEIPGATVIRSSSRLTVGAARNLGLAHVSTEYVLVLDADDELMPGTVGFLLNRMNADPDLSVCATSALDDATGERHRAPRDFVHRFVRLRRLFAVADSIWSMVPIQGCALLRSKDALASGYADSDWADDWVMAVSLAFRGQFEVHKRVGRRYRRTPGSLSQSVRSNRELMDSARLVRARIRADTGIPRWAQFLLPAIYACQWLAVYAVRPLYLRVRREW